MSIAAGMIEGTPIEPTARSSAQQPDDAIVMRIRETSSELVGFFAATMSDPASVGTPLS